MSRPSIDAKSVPLVLSDDVDVFAEPATVAKFDRSRNCSK
jgi:hypothetical protein